MCIDFSGSMSMIDNDSGAMYFQKMRDVVTGTLFNLNCSVQKNDKVNKDTFKFKPEIFITIIGCGLPDLINIGKLDEHICKEDMIECSLPILVLNYLVNSNHIWELVKKVKSQISRIENLTLKLFPKIKYLY